MRSKWVNRGVCMEKYIHYCWFGNNPLPKLAKKCIESWKKYLPDYEIIKWDENNTDLDACNFVREAYENKKWAFVADYARTKAIYDMGGIYFDLDMMVTKPIDFLLEDETFLGVEDSFMVNSAVWGAKEKHSYFAKKMLDYYNNLEHFDSNDMFKMSIPRIMTRFLNEMGFDHTKNEIQKLDHGITIYPREYFYPLAFDFKNNLFTKNTCMIHYFDASWFSKKEKFLVSLKRKFGEKNVNNCLKAYKGVRRAGGFVIKRTLYKPAKYFKLVYLSDGKYKKDINDTISFLNEAKDIIVFHNPDWLGVTSATIELFDSYRVPCREILRKSDVKKIGDTILNKGVKQVIFSAMCAGWKDLGYYLKRKNPNIKLKVFWHGSLSQVSEPYGWERNMELIRMSKDGTLDVFGTCKESSISFYENLGIKTHFLKNTVNLSEKIKENKNENVTIGLYAAKKDDWRKNLFAQIAAVSLIKDVVIDIIPFDPEAASIARMLGLKVTGVEKALPREELLKRMAKNTVNLYVTFSECAPMLPIESFEVGTVCITGNNHHYFKNTDLEEYLVVNNEESPLAIAKKIEDAIKNEKVILDKYKKWKKNYDKESAISAKEFIEL